MRRGEDHGGGSGVLDGDADGLVDGQLLVVGASGVSAIDEFAELHDAVGVEGSAADGLDDVVGSDRERLQHGRAMLDGNKRVGVEGRVEFAAVGDVADGGDVGACPDLACADERLDSAGGRADDVSVVESGGDGAGADVQAVGGEVARELGGLVAVAACEADLAEGSDEGGEAGVGVCLRPGADDGEDLRVGAGEQPSGEGGPGGDGRCPADGESPAVIGSGGGQAGEQVGADLVPARGDEREGGLAEKPPRRVSVEDACASRRDDQRARGPMGKLARGSPGGR